MIKQERAEGTFKVSVSNTDSHDLMGLVLSTAGVKKHPRLGYNIGPDYVDLSRLIRRSQDIRGNRIAEEWNCERLPRGSWYSHRLESIEYFRVKRLGGDIYEVSIMGGKPTILGRRVRQEFSEAFGLLD